MKALGQNMTQPHDIVMFASVFGLALMAWLGVVVLLQIRRSRRQQAVGERLGLTVKSGSNRVLRLWRNNVANEMMIDDLPTKPTIRERLEQLSEEAGLEVPVSTLWLGPLGGGLMVFVLTLAATGRVLPAACGLLATLALFWAYLKRRISARAILFERQLMDAMELAARSLRAGSSLIAAFELIAKEIKAPLGIMFEQICQKQAMGESLENAIQQVASRSSSRDMKLFTASVIIQLRSGGNLALMMDRLAEVIRDRIRLGRRVKVLIAQTQFSKRILVALPLVMFLVINLLNPEYVETLYSSQIGRMLLGGGVASLIVGVILMNKIARIRI